MFFSYHIREASLCKARTTIQKNRIKNVLEQKIQFKKKIDTKTTNNNMNYYLLDQLGTKSGGTATEFSMIRESS